MRYKYYSLTKSGKHKDEFTCYSDIAFEFGVTRNSIAGKFYRARQKQSAIINVDGTLIEQVRSM